MTITTTAPVTLAPAPMPAEVAEAHLQRIEHLLADLEAAATALVGASWGGRSAVPAFSRHLPDGTIAPLTAWMERIQARLTEACEWKNLRGWDS